MRRSQTLLIASLVLAACKPAAEQPPAAKQDDPPAPAEPAPIAAPEREIPAVAAEPPAPDDAPKPEPVEPLPPPPPFVALPSDPSVDPLAFLLGDGTPDGVAIVASHEHGRSRVVLYAVDVAARWLAAREAQDPDDPLLSKLEEGLDACEEEDHYQYLPCRTAAARAVGVPEELAVHVAEPDTRQWLLAHVELDGKGKGRVLARKRLLDAGIPNLESEIETKLKVYDIDGDGRSEALVVFAITLDGNDMLEQRHGAVGYVLDKADLHVQFATTRLYSYHASDLSWHDTEIATTWLARDENADGHADLVVRERKIEVYDPGESESGEPGSKETRNRSTVCLYELTGDRWVCPESLGTEIIDGNALVERTSIPVVLEAPAAPP